MPICFSSQRIGFPSITVCKRTSVTRAIECLEPTINIFLDTYVTFFSEMVTMQHKLQLAILSEFFFPDIQHE